MADDSVSTVETTTPPQDLHREWQNRERMAFIALFSMIVVTVGLFFINEPAKLEQLAVALTWFYGAMASIVAAFVGFKAWAGVKGK